MESNVDATSDRGGLIVFPQIQIHVDSVESDGCHINHKPNQMLSCSDCGNILIIITLHDI